MTDEEFKEVALRSVTYTELIRKLGRPISGGSFITIKNRLKRVGIPESHFINERRTTCSKERGNWGGNTTLKPDEILVNGRHSDGRKENTHKLRSAFLSTGVQELCSICGLKPEWNGQPLRLQIDHINGIPTDNRRENLRFICPNCHSQTETFGTKNVKRPLGRKGNKSHISGEKIERNSVKKKEKALSYRVDVECSGCSVKFLRRKSRIHAANYCTSECKKKYQSVQTKANWPPDAELVEMVKNSSRLQIGKILGVSDKAVSKRLKRIGI